MLSLPRGDWTSWLPRGDCTFWLPRGDCTSWLPRGDWTSWLPRGDCTFWLPRGDWTFWLPRGDCTSWLPRGDCTFSFERAPARDRGAWMSSGLTDAVFLLSTSFAWATSAGHLVCAVPMAGDSDSTTATLRTVAKSFFMCSSSLSCFGPLGLPARLPP